VEVAVVEVAKMAATVGVEVATSCPDGSSDRSIDRLVEVANNDPTVSLPTVDDEVIEPAYKRSGVEVALYRRPERAVGVNGQPKFA